MVNIFQYLENTKGKLIPFKYKLLYNLPLNESDLIINGFLELYGTKLTWLPDNLTVSSFLDISRSNIKSLPNNLTVNGNLYIEGLQITKLPDNLTVGESLSMSDTNILELPDNLIVNGSLYCYDTPLADNINNNEELLKKYKKQIKGKIRF